MWFSQLLNKNDAHFPVPFLFMNEFNILNLIIQKHLLSFSSLGLFGVFQLQLVDYLDGRIVFNL